MIVFGVFVGNVYLEDSFAETEMSPHQQWREFEDLDMLTCRPGYLLFVNIDGDPLCVMPTTYLKLIDRGYGNYDSSIISKRPAMQNNLLQSMASNANLMHHWHVMMQKNPTIMTQTADVWTSQIRDNPELLKNILGPMIGDSKSLQAMIDAMKNHSRMEMYLKQHSEWMDSVHQPVMNSETLSDLDRSACAWCNEYQGYANEMVLKEFANPDRMMDMIHVIWLNSEMSQDLHLKMLQDHSHTEQMSIQMMSPMLNLIMDDEYLRQQMINLLLEHQGFMNAIRHDNPAAEH